MRSLNRSRDQAALAVTAIRIEAEGEVSPSKLDYMSRVTEFGATAWMVSTRTTGPSTVEDLAYKTASPVLRTTGIVWPFLGSKLEMVSLTMVILFLILFVLCD
jgi:hypothetical protein